ncbi:MAG: DUF4810 domain-containing protein [Moraxellaceae bacterium]|nr:DUF4810 domain-containing protein [Moraxellaceae bacterium]MDZ4386316.1 DUF4810 domain-containing protein [Moraxellaceae bacterium]
MKKLLLIGLSVALISGCATQPGYYWGQYEQSLYSYYANPAKSAELSAALASDISYAEEIKRVPPGLYAEYGYLMLESGMPRKAAFYFNKEKELWPESAQFMNTLLQAAIRANSNQTAGTQK